MPKRVGKYEIGKTLGEGTFGKVKRAVDTETQKIVAIKVLDKDKIQKQNMGSQVKKEISIMKLVHHVHVVKLIEVLASRTKIFIVLELVTGGELFDRIVNERKFNETTARFYFQQLVEGTLYCHSRGVCHRDLKVSFILLSSFFSSSSFLCSLASSLYSSATHLMLLCVHQDLVAFFLFGATIPPLVVLTRFLLSSPLLFFFFFFRLPPSSYLPPSLPPSHTLAPQQKQHTA